MKLATQTALVNIQNPRCIVTRRPVVTSSARYSLLHTSKYLQRNHQYANVKLGALPDSDDGDELIEADADLPLNEEDLNIVDELFAASSSGALDDELEEAELAAIEAAEAAAAASSRRTSSFDDAAAQQAVAARASLAAEAGGTNYPERLVRNRSLSELLEAAGYAQQAESAPALDITNIVTCNSIKAGPGSLYVCVPDDSGELDGHDWADEASELGAVAVIAQRPLPDALLPVIVVDDTLKALSRLAAEFYDNPSASPDVTTVMTVGTYGKTTTSWLVRGIFEEKSRLVGMIGSIDYSLGEDRLTKEGDIWQPDPEEIDLTLERDCSSPFHITPYQGKYEAPETTPDALHMQKTLAGIVDRGAEVAIVEVCPSAASDGRAQDVHADVIVFTNVDRDVAENSPGGLDGYIERISAVFDGLTEDQTAIINLDDKIGDGAMLARTASQTGATVLTYSATGNPDADVVAEKTRSGIWETEITVRTPVGSLQIIQLQVGLFNVANILAAVCVGLSQGIELVSIVAGIEAVEIIPGRCELIDEGQAFPVIVDSAKTPQQLSRLIDDVKEAGARRTILVMGCPGSSSNQHRARMTAIAHYKADMVIFTSDDPGKATPDEIIADMVTSGLPDEILTRHAGSYYTWLQDPHRVPQWFEKWLLQYQSEVGRFIIEDRFSAIRIAIGMAKPRDVVLVVGKGDRDYQLYWDGESDLMHDPQTIKGWFDDRVECRNALSKLQYLEGLKDLDRNALPWTRYPEERELPSGSAGDMTDWSIEKYLQDAVEEVTRRAADEDDSQEEEEEEVEGAYGF